MIEGKQVTRLEYLTERHRKRTLDRDGHIFMKIRVMSSKEINDMFVAMTSAHVITKTVEQRIIGE